MFFESSHDHWIQRFGGWKNVAFLLQSLLYYLQQILVINWRRWLTTKYIDEWMQNKTYYRLQMFGVGTDNPDQRISEDVRLFVEMTIRFSIGILKALCTLVSFVFILWDLSGPLDFKMAGIDIHIGGYLVWVALLYSIVGTWITHMVGHKLGEFAPTRTFRGHSGSRKR